MSFLFQTSRWQVVPQRLCDAYSSRRNTNEIFWAAKTGFQHSSVRFKQATRNDQWEAAFLKVPYLFDVSLSIGFRREWWSNSSSPHRTTCWRPLFRKLNFNQFPIAESGSVGNGSQILILHARLPTVHSFKHENQFPHGCSKKSTR